MKAQPITSLVNFVGVIVTLFENDPWILVSKSSQGIFQLPIIPFNPTSDRTLEIGFRTRMAEQFGVQLGYAEQLYTFGNQGRNISKESEGLREISIAYVSLVPHSKVSEGGWVRWYDLLPWEDFREGMPEILKSKILPKLQSWSQKQALNSERFNLAFGYTKNKWNQEKSHDRFELLFESSLIAESNTKGEGEGCAMWGDHRRIVASALSRVRGKIRYRPIIFELMPPTFTLYELQMAVEALSGVLLHKQNFRRLLEQGGLVEATGKTKSETGGRPAELYSFRREVLFERPEPGIRSRSFPVIG